MVCEAGVLHDDRKKRIDMWIKGGDAMPDKIDLTNVDIERSTKGANSKID